MKALSTTFRFAGICALVFLLSRCAPPPGAGSIAPAPAFSAPSAPLGSDGVSRSSRPKLSKDRPGLATGFGDSVGSPMRRTSFVRASRKPAGIDTVYYNDKEGIEAMTGYTSRGAKMKEAAGGIIEWGIKSGHSFLPARSSYNWKTGGKRFVIARKGKNYKIVLRNKSRARAEVVLSVDGLDVMDGKAASVRKRGYILDPGETLEVKGFRTSRSSVAKFRFSEVAGSYAALKHGKTRNVGVIGMVVFTEKGFDPWTWMPREIKRRNTAEAFAEAP